MKSQAEIVKQMTNAQLKKSVYMSELLLFVLSIGLSILLFDSVYKWLDLFYIDIMQLFWLGVVPGLTVVGIDLLLMKFVPERFLDDGGINTKLFSNSSITEIMLLTLVISIAEELLFRGVIQTSLGYIVASIVFALVHVRYVRKPILFISILCISFYIGYLFVRTNNLMVTITAHFVIDSLLGFIVRFKSEGGIRS
ncbi:CPBP family intramembrane metalloprotease [Aquibacillus sp. 3ASR75-11]|uniref:CPBP family intramembrane metalloprotease n=1 Tax=Terrihalobacillus insolitus TaxID=2950438 RepID=A0A9X4ANS7_9BACI|nr:type II CAAX endopeptidase family protein [Terrihalobacillus insolitus]MDC3413083.1 CPBP family intramembrane metalloprotease [Terrihalobacillus insolitus]MDC3424825.1 CPBP family intramembrane metalloprotease [Terrihalobacillus insolitus]